VVSTSQCECPLDGKQTAGVVLCSHSDGNNEHPIDMGLLALWLRPRPPNEMPMLVLAHLTRPRPASAQRAQKRVHATNRALPCASVSQHPSADPCHAMHKEIRYAKKGGANLRHFNLCRQDRLISRVQARGIDHGSPISCT
jgi:hypothetical protein